MSTETRERGEASQEVTFELRLEGGGAGHGKSVRES